MQRAGGHIFEVDGDGRQTTIDTITCAHCCRIVKVNGKLDEVGGFCRMCMKPICARCVEREVCDPFEKKLERAEAIDRLRRSYG